MRRNSLTPIDLRRNDSGRSVTFGTDNEHSTSPDGLSRNPSTRDYSAGTQLSRHDSSHSYQSFLSTPILSRSGSLRLPPTEVGLNFTFSLLALSIRQKLNVHLIYMRSLKCYIYGSTSHHKSFACNLTF